MRMLVAAWEALLKCGRLWACLGHSLACPVPFRYHFAGGKGQWGYEDHYGREDILKPGDYHWVVSGRGVVHSEIAQGKEDADVHGLHIWLNTPFADKMLPYDTVGGYAVCRGKDIPKARQGAVTATILAGEALGGAAAPEAQPAASRGRVTIVHYVVGAGGTLEHVLPTGWTCLIYVRGYGYSLVLLPRVCTRHPPT